jgi:hypothetical protein
MVREQGGQGQGGGSSSLLIEPITIHIIVRDGDKKVQSRYKTLMLSRIIAKISHLICLWYWKITIERYKVVSKLCDLNTAQSRAFVAAFSKQQPPTNFN